jgi:hypothetical protein
MNLTGTALTYWMAGPAAVRWWFGARPQSV